MSADNGDESLAKSEDDFRFIGIEGTFGVGVVAVEEVVMDACVALDVALLLIVGDEMPPSVETITA